MYNVGGLIADGDLSQTKLGLKESIANGKEVRQRKSE